MNKPSITVRLLPLIVFPVTFVLSFYILLGIASVRLKHNQENYTDEVFATFAEVGRDSAMVLDRLNSLNFDTCTEENLAEMRETRFESQFARQIVFYMDDLGVCTTGTGVLDEPIQRPPPDYVSADGGTEIWLNREFLMELTGRMTVANIVKTGNYSVMTDPLELNSNYTRPYQWQMVILGAQDEPHHVAGTRGLYDPDAEKTDGIYYYFACNENQPDVCFILSASLPVIIQELPFLGIMVIMVSLVVAFIVDVYTRRYLLNRMDLTRRVVKGMLNHTFYWNFQPVVDMTTRKVVGCELLARFADQFGREATESFLAVVRQAGQTWEFTEIMISRAMSDMDAYEWPEGFRVHMNIFPADLVSGDVRKLASNAVIKNKPYSFVLEVSETDLLDDETVVANLQFLQQQGFSVAIDDFGTGYSNIDQLKTLGCDFIKIDQSYVNEIEDTSIKSSLVPHIVGIGNKLSLDVIAEGVESEQQKNALKNLGVRYGQGWYLGMPGSVEELANSVAFGLMKTQTEETGQ